eukprot:SAG31_NODE_6242_length_2106_cov_1.481814_1_plen_84_part_10
MMRAGDELDRAALMRACVRACCMLLLVHGVAARCCCFCFCMVVVVVVLLLLLLLLDGLVAGLPSLRSAAVGRLLLCPMAGGGFG